MIRGTTPTHIFNLPFEVDIVECVRITYAQRGKTVFTKGDEDVELEGNQVRVTLTQEDTLMFDCNDCVYVQLKVKTVSGQVLATTRKKVGITTILCTEVL